MFSNVSNRISNAWCHKTEAVILPALSAASWHRGRLDLTVPSQMPLAIRPLIMSLRASLVTQMVKNPPAMPETWVWSLGGDDALKKRTATHSSILAWKMLWIEKPGRLQSMGLQRIGHDWSNLAVHTHCQWTLGFTGVQISLRVSVFHSFRCMSRNGIAGSSDNSTFNFLWGTDFHSNCSFYIPISRVWGVRIYFLF